MIDRKEELRQRQELINLKKIHKGEVEKQPKAEPENMKPRSKWEHFMFYYKWPTVAIVLVVAVLAFVIRDSATRVKEDYSVLLATSKYYTESEIIQFKNQLSEYGYDVNGDGKVVVDVINIMISDPNKKVNDPQIEMAMNTKLMGELSAGDSVILFFDDLVYKKITNNSTEGFADITSYVPSLKLEKKDRIPLGILTSFNKKNKIYQKYKDLDISIRNQLKNDKNTNQRFNRSEELLSNILNNKKPRG